MAIFTDTPWVRSCPISSDRFEYRGAVCLLVAMVLAMWIASLFFIRPMLS